MYGTGDQVYEACYVQLSAPMKSLVRLLLQLEPTTRSVVCKESAMKKLRVFTAEPTMRTVLN